MKKYNITTQKQKEMAIERTLKKARVPQNASIDEIKEHLIHYVSKLKTDTYKVMISDELLSDPNFLLSLYKTNINMVDTNSPDPNNLELQDNVDFMIEYIKFKYSKVIKEFPNPDKHWTQIGLRWAVKNYDRTMSNREFIERLAEIFPNQEIIPLIKDAICKKYNTSDKDKEEKEKQDQLRYKKCLTNLPTELLCDQVRQFGRHTLKEIPNDIPSFNHLLSTDIENNGFKSMDCLDITQVLDNLDLILKAYEKDGVQSLIEYIDNTLSPKRTQYYMSNGQKHHYTTYDKRYAEVQKALISSPEIQSAFRKANLDVKISKTETTHLSIEPCEKTDEFLRS